MMLFRIIKYNPLTEDPLAGVIVWEIKLNKKTK